MHIGSVALVCIDARFFVSACEMQLPAAHAGDRRADGIERVSAARSVDERHATTIKDTRSRLSTRLSPARSAACAQQLRAIVLPLPANTTSRSQQSFRSRVVL